MYIYICMIHMHFVLISPPTHPIYTFLPCDHIRMYVCLYIQGGDGILHFPRSPI